MNENRFRPMQRRGVYKTSSRTEDQVAAMTVYLRSQSGLMNQPRGLGLGKDLAGDPQGVTELLQAALWIIIHADCNGAPKLGAQEKGNTVAKRLKRRGCHCVRLNCVSGNPSEQRQNPCPVEN